RWRRVAHRLPIGDDPRLRAGNRARGAGQHRSPVGRHRGRRRPDRGCAPGTEVAHYHWSSSEARAYRDRDGVTRTVLSIRLRLPRGLLDALWYDGNDGNDGNDGSNATHRENRPDNAACPRISDVSHVPVSSAVLSL